MTRVAFLWHMHQPFYEDLVTREHILPWVRLHALKDYYGMVAVLREFPEIKATFNLVPSLLVQLEAFAADRARDRSLELSLKPAQALEPGDAQRMLDTFFHAQPQRMIEPYPRYAELWMRRGSPPSTFTVDELRDLQVWHKLAWVDPSYFETDVRVRTLVARGRDFSEADKAVLREVELELLNRVIPEYRAAAERGQIEVSGSPFYHPILPLLCDTDVYLQTHPNARTPRQRFQHPEDAAEQLHRAVACHERLFGARPVGLWPSEGSVSNAMAPLVARAGFEWMATDELILARTLGVTFTRDGFGHVEQPERLYAPYCLRAGGESVGCVFRDHVLSDLIGFTYAGWAPDAAADDFIGRLVEAGRRYQGRVGGEEPLVPIILDGENAWEHFEGGGRPFLRALYRRLTGHPELRTVTMREAARGATRELSSIFPGSWIDANFSIWIGHADDQRAWSQLADAREALSTVPATAATAGARAAAYEEILVAEGSDWCWWYGDDHSSAHDLEFDDLFRRHLRNAYQLIGKPVPDELFVSNISHGLPPPVLTQPNAWLSPRLDGQGTGYFDWLGAGSLEIRQTAGAMHRTSGDAPSLTLVQFGFNRERLLLVRVDATRPMLDVLADGYEVSLKFLRPEGVRFSVRRFLGRLVGHVWRRAPVPAGGALPWVDHGPGGAIVGAGTVLELGLPLAELEVSPGDTVAFFVAVYDAREIEIERHPAHRPIEVGAPDALFDARNWQA
ncbi:MAG TPA: glycoside hydrolase family 57 protein [Vicinamibacterales bacterium]|nr:glycoside hydrolase family 57 protein [Vicinamibacterales bacterium]